MADQKNFINFHVLISHSPSCLNRDDQNMQKRAVFGGVERIRISSQSLKRAMRRPPDNSFNYWSDYANFGLPSTRTRSVEQITEFMVSKLSEEFKDDDVIKKTIAMFINSKKVKNLEDDENDDEELAENTDSKKIAVAPWVIDEIKSLCRIIKDCKDNGLTDDEKGIALKKVGKEVGKKGNKRKLTPDDCIEDAIIKKIVSKVEEKKNQIAESAGSAIDLALWGRMATSGLMTTIDGSLAVAHAITTHAAETEIDWFTAVDDLVKLGTGHLDTQEFSSGVFYRYASLNIAQLQQNLGGATRERVLEISKHVFHMLCTVVPSAKQQPFAAHNAADFAIVSFADQPISLANAFEKPVQKNNEGGYYDPSVEELLAYWKSSNEFYGLEEIAACCSKNKKMGISAKLIKKDTVCEVETWIKNDGNEKKEGV